MMDQNNLWVSPWMQVLPISRRTSLMSFFESDLERNSQRMMNKVVGFTLQSWESISVFLLINLDKTGRTSGEELEK
jgi:hypothetical protein